MRRQIQALKVLLQVQSFTQMFLMIKIQVIGFLLGGQATDFLKQFFHQDVRTFSLGPRGSYM